jgi:glycosyltransferase EpsJ
MSDVSAPFLISVIIPVYNAEKTIGTILGKLMEQPYGNIEIIVINDGSTDESPKIISLAAKRDNRIVFVEQKNAGVGAARNAGIKRASGEFITFIDADDSIDSLLISELARHANDDTDFVMCGMATNGKKAVAQDANINSKHEVADYVLKSLLTNTLFYGPYCKLFRRQLIVENGILFDAKIKYGEDTIFNLKYLANAQSLCNIGRSLYVYNYSQSGLAAANKTNLQFRAVRTKALKSYLHRQNLSAYRFIMYAAIRARWGFAIIKSNIRKAGK